MGIDVYHDVVVVCLVEQVGNVANNNTSVLASADEQVVLLAKEISGRFQGVGLQVMAGLSSRRLPLNLREFITRKSGVFLEEVIITRNKPGVFFRRSCDSDLCLLVKFANVGFGFIFSKRLCSVLFYFSRALEHLSDSVIENAESVQLVLELSQRARKHVAVSNRVTVNFEATAGLLRHKPDLVGL